MEDLRNFELNGKKFKLSKLDAFKQFHVARRIGPMLSDLVSSSQMIGNLNQDEMSDGEKLEQFSKLAKPFMDGISKLSDADADYVLLRLLSCVEVHQEQFNSWAKVSTESAIAMQDLELPILLQIAGRSLMFNLSGFFASLPRK